MADIYEIIAVNNAHVAETAPFVESKRVFEVIHVDELKWEPGKPHICILTTVNASLDEQSSPIDKSIIVFEGMSDHQFLIRSLSIRGCVYQYQLPGLSGYSNSLSAYLTPEQIARHTQCFIAEIPGGGFTVNELKDIFTQVDNVLHPFLDTDYAMKYCSLVNSFIMAAFNRTKLLVDHNTEVDTYPV